MNTIILLHLVVALFSLLLGTYVLINPKGTSVHKIMGRIYVLLMLVTAFSSFFITQINAGGFSFIHILSIVILISIARAIYTIRNGNIKGHQYAMIGAYWSLVGAFVFTFLPGRDMYNISIGFIRFLSN